MPSVVLSTGKWSRNFPGRGPFCDYFTMQLTHACLLDWGRFSTPFSHVFSMVTQDKTQGPLGCMLSFWVGLTGERILLMPETLIRTGRKCNLGQFFQHLIKQIHGFVRFFFPQQRQWPVGRKKDCLHIVTFKHPCYPVLVPHYLSSWIMLPCWHVMVACSVPTCATWFQ